MMHVCPTIGPSMPCAQCTPGETYHIPIWIHRHPQDMIFRKQSYRQRYADGTFIVWWEWVPVTPLDGTAATRNFARSAH